MRLYLRQASIPSIRSVFRQLIGPPASPWESPERNFGALECLKFAATPGAKTAHIRPYENFIIFRMSLRTLFPTSLSPVGICLIASARKTRGLWHASSPKGFVVMIIVGRVVSIQASPFAKNRLIFAIMRQKQRQIRIQRQMFEMIISRNFRMQMQRRAEEKRSQERIRLHQCVKIRLLHGWHTAEMWRVYVT
ncbi:hypothetical protein TcasGA2_TC011153 [Tribolium castaneum]|uniref:Uncharacterized protein n=1 Tax=Tribolium castaneum TaxID=7070 RepID=D6X408_TRICA|nr:hypothetical protein TcasGA2_TC011153 [Tribolium castaneum]